MAATTSAGSSKTIGLQSAGYYQEAGPLMKKADRYMWISCAIGGTWAFGFLAIPFFILTFVYLSRAQQAGQLTRPWGVTIIGMFCLVDCMVNYAGWGTDFLWSHNTSVMETIWPGYGKLFDGAYYLDYNGTPLGGLANYSEKTLEFIGVLGLYPMRIAACYGFLKMKRWGLQAMIMTSWFYLAWWTGYAANLYQDFDARVGIADFGNIGLWFILIVYANAFITMPYLYTINRELFSED